MRLQLVILLALIGLATCLNLGDVLGELTTTEASSGDMVQPQITQDEIKEKLIEQFNALVDKLIERLKDGKFLNGELVEQIIAKINEMREYNINAINIFHEKIKDLTGYVRNVADAVLKAIRTQLGREDR